MNHKQNQPGENPLGTQPISRLLVKYAVPSVISMLVMALYNIVDQIFIGWGVGFIGNGATTIIFPLVTVALAVALLVGNGSAAYISLEMGRGNTDNVKKTLGNAVVLILATGVGLMAITLLFIKPILLALGATEAVMPHAISYGSVIAIGFPFSMVATGLSFIIRADGSPRFSMVATLAGCLLNVALDPLFIFTLGMGVQGAAIATVISQFVSTVIILLYFVKYAHHTRLKKKHLRVYTSITKKVAAYGSSSFITQLAITIVNVVLNHSLKHYGALSAYGSDIPISAMGIVMKISAILLACILGISIGAQPILGFNYGAGNYRRVRRTYLTTIAITVAMSTVVWILFITVPQLFIDIFGDSNPQFNEFASKALRTYLGAVILAGFQIPSANYFQAVGKPLKAMTLSMSRQLLLLVPAMLILPLFWGLDGILFSAPVADTLASIITLFFIIGELRHLSTDLKNASATKTSDNSTPCVEAGE